MHTWPVQDAKAHFSELLHASITQGASLLFMRKRNGCFSFYCRIATLTKLTTALLKVLADYAICDGIRLSLNEGHNSDAPTMLYIFFHEPVT